MSGPQTHFIRPTEAIANFSNQSAVFHSNFGLYQVNNNNVIFEGKAMNIHYRIDRRHECMTGQTRMLLVGSMRPIWAILENYACM